MRRWWPLVAICLGTFMLLVDVTIVNVALPAMAGALDSSFAGLQWVIDGYALALAALLMVTGSLADRFGRRRLYLTGLAVFAVASLACGLAPSAGALVAARVVQGAGGAAMFATTAALIAATYHGRDRGTAFGVWGAVNGLAAACGPLVGGVLTETWGWRAIFLVNLPVAAIAIALTLAVLAPDVLRGGAARIDLGGAAAFTVASSALVYGLIEAGAAGWSATSTVVALVLAAVALVAFVLVERRVEHPMLDLALFGRSFSALMVAAAVLSAAAFAHLALVSLWLQEVLHLSPIRAGLAVVPLSIAAFVVSAVSGRLHTGSPVGPVAGGLALVGGGVLLMTVVDTGSGPWALLPGLVVSGLGVGLATPVLVSATLAVLPPAKAGVGSAAVNTFRQLGLAVGLAVLGTVFAGHADPTDPGSPGWTDGLDAVFLTAGVAGLVAAVLVVVLVRRPAPTTPSPTPAPSPFPSERRAPSVG